MTDKKKRTTDVKQRNGGEHMTTHIGRNNDIAGVFMTKIEQQGFAMVKAEDLTAILTSFPITGGIEGSIVVNVNERIVRLQATRDEWLAEEIVARNATRTPA